MKSKPQLLSEKEIRLIESSVKSDDLQPGLLGGEYYIERLMKAMQDYQKNQGQRPVFEN